MLSLCSMRVALIAAIGLLLVAGAVAACVNQPSFAGATQPAATQAVSTQASPTPVPSTEAAPTEPAATPVIYSQVQKNAEGGHGGPRPIDLPSDVVVDYSVTGTCSFDVSFEPEDGSPTTQSFTLPVSDAAAGSWDVHLRPGRYLVDIGEAVGCTFLVTVRSPG